MKWRSSKDSNLLQLKPPQHPKVKLRYVLDTTPGYGRVRRGRGHGFVGPSGQRITDAKSLERLRQLVIPPAWKDVWISPYGNGHLQATGIDEEGRKQYLYHPEWTKDRQRKKLGRMAAFGKALPYIRSRRAKDLREGALVRDKVTAIALSVMEETLIRVGSAHYFQRYGNHGLTTLKKKHVRIDGNNIRFRFRGKKGVWQEITVRSNRLAAFLTELSELRGSQLFQYGAAEGDIRKLTAGDINGYIQRYTEARFSSKDYRTWYAGLWAFRLLAQMPDCDSEKEREKAILSVLDAVSHRLGNTRAVCKHYYVPDSLIQAYRSGSLSPYLRAGRPKHTPTKKEATIRLIAFLEDSIQAGV